MMMQKDCTGYFNCLVGNVTLKKELSRVEEKGVEAHIEEVFENLFGFSLLEETFWTTGFNVPEEHEGLGFNGRIEIDDGIFLHHFALTDNNIVVAVCENGEEFELYYRIAEE